MRLPRRVPWTSLAELDELCSWIYTDETDLDAKIRAVNRISAWKAITRIPHALEATLSLLSAVLLDEEYILSRQAQQEAHSDIPDQSSPRFGSRIALNVRQSYAMALVRMVNGLVDPLQLGAYARSISSIALQIGLPIWLVELRHTATHEDLPSLEALRSGARESLSWLLHNYFMPTLQASADDQSLPTVQLAPVTPLLKEYKSIQKTVTRDSSLKGQYKGELAHVIRNIERWVGEAKVVASAIACQGWGAIEQDDNQNENEKWALDRLCEALSERGGLIPVSKKKRLASKPKELLELPTSLVAIWSPLLDALVLNHPSFPSVLVSNICNKLLSGTSAPNSEPQKVDISYDFCLAAWGAWCVDRWGVKQTDETSTLNRDDLVVNIITSLGSPTLENQSHRQGANALLSLLVRDHPTLQEVSSSLLALQDHNKHHEGKVIDIEDNLAVMEERLNSLLSRGSDLDEQERPMDIENETDSPNSEIGLPAGWSKISHTDWKACPIGVWPIQYSPDC